jgi:hypothetical protein
MSATLAGTVILQGGQKNIVVRFFTPDTDTEVMKACSFLGLSAQGTFIIYDIPPGTYDVGIKCDGGLSILVEDQVFTEGEVTSINFGTLLQGDLTGDDYIDASDSDLVTANWNLQGGCYGYAGNWLMPDWTGNLRRQFTDYSDGCWVYYDGSNWNFLGSYLFSIVGYYYGGYYANGGGLRFSNITIPKGSKILAAHLTVTPYLSCANTVVRSKIRAENSANPQPFSDITDYLARSRTTQFIYDDDVPPQVGDVPYTSPDFADVIQALVNLPDWVSGNPIVLFWDDHDDRSDHNNETVRVTRYYAVPNWSPILCIEYEEPAAGGIATKLNRGLN